MEKLVNMSKRGDTEAFTQLMQSQMQNMYKTARTILSNVLSLVFTILYPITISRVGYEYKNSIFVPIQENNNIIYSGKIHGTQAH